MGDRERKLWRAVVAGRDALLAAYRVGGRPKFGVVDKGGDAEEALKRRGVWKDALLPAADRKEGEGDET